MKYYQVGGSVRDEILGEKSRDIDFAVECPSYEAMRNDILAKQMTIFLESPQYLTIRAKTKEGEVADFVLCRKEGAYYDGRHPSSVEPGTIYDDLARRDFTMNAIAKDMETGEIIDPHNGRLDIGAHLVECVGDAEARIQEDSLRMLRAIRFAITKEFYISPTIQELIHTYGRDIQDVSVERVREELLKCFAKDTLRTWDYLEKFEALRKTIFGKMGLRLTPTLKQS